MSRNHLPFPTVDVCGCWAFADGKVQCLSLSGNAKAVHVVLMHGEVWQCTVTLTPKRAIISQVSPTSPEYSGRPHLFSLVSEARLIEAAERIAGLH